MKKPKISIVIPAKNSRDSLKRCLSSIRSQDFKSYEIIVVDGFSSDGTAELCHRMADRLILSQASVPGCRNVGFSVARGEIFLSVDSDMVLEGGLLADIALRMDAHGALVIPELGIGKGVIARCKSLEKKCYLNNPDVESARAFSRDAFRFIGGYDASLLYGEDRDLHCRIAAACSIGRSSKRLFHDAGSLSLSSAISKAYRYGKSSRRFYSKNNPGTQSLSLPVRPLFLGHFPTILSEPLPAFCLVGLKSVEGAAFALGYLLSGAQSRSI